MKKINLGSNFPEVVAIYLPFGSKSLERGTKILVCGRKKIYLGSNFLEVVAIKMPCGGKILECDCSRNNIGRRIFYFGDNQKNLADQYCFIG